MSLVSLVTTIITLYIFSWGSNGHKSIIQCYTYDLLNWRKQSAIIRKNYAILCPL